MTTGGGQLPHIYKHFKHFTIMARTKFGLFMTYEEALAAAEAYQQQNEGTRIWKDPRNWAQERITFDTAYFFSLSSFEKDLAEDYDLGEIQPEAKYALFWLIQRHRGFNSLELGQVIVGEQGGTRGDTEDAIFCYLSRENDLLRQFITEKGYDLAQAESL